MFPSRFDVLRDDEVEAGEEDDDVEANLLTLAKAMSSLLEGAVCNLREPSRMWVNIIDAGSSARSVEK